jgi:CHAT domain-containing protein
MKRRLGIALVLVVVAVGGWLAYRQITRPDDVMSQLARARPARVFAPRLSIEIKHRPCTRIALPADSTVPRNDCGKPGEVPRDLERLAGGVESVDPDTLHVSALAAVIWGSEKEVVLNAAIERLLKALALTLDRDLLLVDLSGLHLARADRTQNARDVIQGLDYAVQALERNPRNASALYNAALALDWFAIDEEALRAWNAYLAVDSTSPWADDARARRDALQKARPVLRRPTVRSSAAEVDAFADSDPQGAREMGWDFVLGAWGSAVLEGNTARADSLLALTERLGAALERRQNGDASLADAVRAIRGARDPVALRTLARAHRAYAAGQSLFKTRDQKEAQDSFAVILQVHKSLPTRSPALLAWTHASHTAPRVYDPQDATVWFAIDSLRKHPDVARYRALSARVYWMQALRQLRFGEQTAARTSYARAARTYALLSETENYGAMVAGQAESAYESGDTVVAYQQLHRGLLMLRLQRNSIRLHNLLVDLAETATTDGMQRAASPIQDEDVAVAKRVNRPVAAPEALATRARVRALSGDTTAALKDLTDAAPLVEKVVDQGDRQRITNILRYSRTLAIRSPEVIPQSVAGLDSAISYFAENVLWLMPSLVRRAELHLASGNLSAASADLDSVTGRIRRTTQGQQDFHLRAAMIEQARLVFDRLVMMHVRANRPEKALEALERGRTSFSLADGGEAGTSGGLSAPPGQVALEYALIGDTLLTWTVRGASVQMRRDTVDRDSLLLTIERAGALLEAPGNDDLARPELERLYERLIRPVRDRLPADTPLVILADGEIARVPFEALRDARSGRYLVQDHSTRHAPSLAEAAQVSPPTHDSALLVADPAFDLYRNATFRRLGGAKAEVDSLGQFYPGADLLIHESATVDALLARAGGVSVIHYAGHAVFDDTRPERSFLLLADDSTGGRLTADSVVSLDLRGVRLVVLSACRTLRSREGRSGGFAGMPGALLGAGVGGVVGNLWEVDDARTVRLMTTFHREYRRSHDPAEALRQAQLDMLRSGDTTLASPKAWAGFRYMGR